MGYKDLEVWQLAHGLVIDIHRMTLEKLPGFESHEEGSQIRRSIKTVKSTIVEGYGRRKYNQDYVRYLIIAISSNDETIDHLETLHDTKSLVDEDLYRSLHDRLVLLGKKLNVFIKAIQQRTATHMSSKIKTAINPVPSTQDLEPSNG